MDFNECLKKKIAKKINPDLELIKSLKKSSWNKLDSAEKLELTEITAGSKISLLYDSLREILEAMAIAKGYKIYNHECYTCFLKEVLNESVKGDEFDELRKIRNGINYYAKEISVQETREVLNRMKRLRKEIINKINNLH
jgi:hypothetical protein